MRKNKEITITIKFNPETAKLHEILAECKQKFLDSLPFMDQRTMSNVNQKAIQNARIEMRNKNIHVGYYAQHVITCNGLLAYLFHADGIKTIPAEQRENATKVMQCLNDHNILLLSRLNKRIQTFKEKSNNDKEEYIFPDKIPGNLIPKKEMKKLVQTIIEGKGFTNKNDILAKNINNLCLLFMPVANVSIKKLKTPAPKNAHTDPYIHTRREFCDKDIIRTYVEGMLAGIKEIQKTYKI